MVITSYGYIQLCLYIPTVMVIYSYGYIQLWLYTVMVIYSYGNISLDSLQNEKCSSNLVYNK